MGLFEHDGSFDQRDLVDGDHGIGLGVDLEVIALGDPHPDMLAGKRPGDGVAAATVGEEQSEVTLRVSSLTPT